MSKKRTVLRSKSSALLEFDEEASEVLTSPDDDQEDIDVNEIDIHHLKSKLKLPSLQSDNEDNSGHQSFKFSKPVSLLSGSHAQKKAWQLAVGAGGIYGAYLYYGNVQEDLFRYRSAEQFGFSYVWFLQVLESAVTIIIGYLGRKFYGGRDNLPVKPFLKSGASQLLAKALMSLSLAAGLSFPVVVLAKSAKILPTMLGQIILGGSSYTARDYIFALLIVCGTALLSMGKSKSVPGNDTVTGLVFIVLSLTADGFTGGLQKRLKIETANMEPTTYDFLFYSHIAMWGVAMAICLVTGEIWKAPAYLMGNPAVWWYVLASCVCSSIGQCFIFYVIAAFDPLVCTTITTTRKMLSVILSISFKGHDLSSSGLFGLLLALTALFVEVEGKVSRFREPKQKQEGSNIHKS